MTVPGRADQREGPERWTIHVCPECGYYDADPILRRADGIRCSRCGHDAVRALDLRRVNSNFHHTRKQQAKDGAPLMVATQVVPLSALREVEAERNRLRQALKPFAEQAEIIDPTDDFAEYELTKASAYTSAPVSGAELNRARAALAALEGDDA